jgi:hypothetical protein
MENYKMTKKKAIALAVAGLCTSPSFAAAAGISQAADLGHWEVITPSSPNEAAPHLTLSRSHLGTPPARVVVTATAEADAPAAYAEVSTPPSADARARSNTVDSRHQRSTRARSAAASMPNPQTPWSPNESGPNNYAADMQKQTQHLASVAEAHRIAAASYEPAPIVATVETPTSPEAAAAVDRALAATPDAPKEGDRESVAAINPALVDSRQGVAPELRVENVPSEPPAPGSAPVAAQGTVPNEPVGTTAAAAAVSSAVAGGSAEASAAATPPKVDVTAALVDTRAPVMPTEATVAAAPAAGTPVVSPASPLPAASITEAPASADRSATR